MNVLTMASDTVHDNIQAIKGELRAAMNGIASRAIRESGMGYRLAFGTELPRLREIAKGFNPDRHLALALWQENIRETKMLAIMLYPQNEFDADMADIWMSDLVPEQAEIAQLLAMDLLAHLPSAADMAFRWMADEHQMQQLCGFLVVTRLLMQGAELSPDAQVEFIDQAASALPTSYLPLRKAVQNALLRYAETSTEANIAVDKLLGSQC